MGLKIKLLVLFSLLCLIILIPQSFAIENATSDVADSSAEVEDYYFDVDADSDGDGSSTSPYKNFTDDRIIDNSTVHLAGGEYSFQKSRTFSNISFNGLNPKDTILNGNGTTLTISGLVSFSNITLTNFHIVNENTLNASNTVFTNLIPTYPEGDNSNDFGGAIVAFKNKNIYLDNCTFFNNSAQYGGAIYASGGNLTILNSMFYNNTAYSFAGAILGDSRLKIIINNTKFICDNSIEDAGGAIYIVYSTLNASNMEISNCSATFGSAITALSSDLILDNVTLKDNVAGYDGGAIYQFYGTLQLNSSRFISNSARNGAGLYIDEVNVINITSNEFINNTASNYAGAIYSYLKNDFNLSGNVFENNAAYLFNDVYNTSSVSYMDLGNGNYSMYLLNQTYNSTIPSSYDLREYGLVTSVKDQEAGGNCWAFAAIAALESCVLKASGETLDLSEENMKNLMEMFSDYGLTNYYTNDGGTQNMARGYLVSWLGPVNEEDDKYDDKSHLSSVLNSILHVQNVLYLKRDNYTDNDAIKLAILNYGAVATKMYYLNDNKHINLHWDSDGTRKICYYYHEDESMPINHAVTIVGWDDSVNVPNAPGRGAWIVKNSWGPDWLGGAQYNNHNGYFYVSYYDYAFARPGDFNSFTFILNDTQHFDKNYQYEILGPTDYFYVNQNVVWYENAFYATDNEFLSGVSTYFNKDTNWELFIYVNSKLQLVQSGSGVPGYFTINLDYPIPVAMGEAFEIVFKITDDKNVGFPIYEPGSNTKISQIPETSFVSLNGVQYLDLYNLVHSYPGHIYANQVACIKGFTQLITLNSTSKALNITYDSLDLFNITLSLLDENNNAVRNGRVVFNVNGMNHSVDVFNGVAFLQIPFVLGINNISWNFTSPNYSPLSGNVSHEVPPIKLNMTINVLQDFNNAYVNFTFSQSINENLTVIINGANQTLEAKMGMVYLNMTGLDYGEYNISAYVDKEVYDCRNSTSFFVNVKRTNLNVSDLVTVYNSGALYSVKLSDQFNMSVVGRKVKFIVGDNVYYNITDENGTASIAINLKDSVYPTEIVFEGDDLYIESQNSSLITVNSSISLPEIKKYTLNSNYEFYLIDRDGNPLNNTLVNVNANNRNYNVRTDSNGKAVFAIPFTSGNFILSVLNPDTGESLSQDIEVIKRLTGSKDISVYFGNYPVFKVRVCDDNGNFAGGINVKLTLNVRVYNFACDNNGWVSLKINLKAGKYTIISECNGFKVSNKITINPTLITKDKKVKKAKRITYQAKLLNKNGKAIKGKKITFKIKGKTYRAKTNRKGIATIKIANLKVGKYKITAKYLKLTSVSKITVKK